jgi:hypothetical protein
MINEKSMANQKEWPQSQKEVSGRNNNNNNDNIVDSCCCDNSITSTAIEWIELSVLIILCMRQYYFMIIIGVK